MRNLYALNMACYCKVRRALIGRACRVILYEVIEFQNLLKLFVERSVIEICKFEGRIFRKFIRRGG